MNRIGELTRRALADASGRPSPGTRLTDTTTQPRWRESEAAAASESETGWTCPRCGATWEDYAAGRAFFKPYGEERTTTGCESCLVRDAIAPQVRANRIAAYGLDSGLLAGMTLESFKPLTRNESLAKEAAFKVAERWRAGVSSWIWFWSRLREPAETAVLGGRARRVTGCGCGKTHLGAGLARIAVDLNHDVRLTTEGDLLNAVKECYVEGARRS